MSKLKNKRDADQARGGADEASLAAACRRGERRAQRELYERYKDPMYGLCLRFADTPEDAEDLLQEGFIRVFRDIGTFRGSGSLEGWIRRVVLHTGLQYIRKRQNELPMVDIAALEHLLAENPIGDDPYEPGRLVKALQQMPPGFRAVLNLYVVEEQSHEEIARELGIAVGTSKSQLQRAKAFLRRLLDKTMLLL
jgi:RNA polymerase sigma factor (sigma-70 family)